jgi:hypothetical protein
MTIDSTVKRTEALPFVARAGLCIVLACFGFVLGIGLFLLIPVIGLFLGPIVVLGSVSMLFVMFINEPSFSANCPYCGVSGDAGNPGAVTKCRHCKNRFVHRDGLLWKI